jgi:hypothetical protein
VPRIAVVGQDEIMKVDIGTQGTVVGTKRVNKDGHVAGLKRYEGKDVLIVVPDGEPVLRPGVSERVRGVTTRVRTNLRTAVDAARATTPGKVVARTAKRLEDVRSRRPVMTAETWARTQVEKASQRVQEGATSGRRRLDAAAEAAKQRLRETNTRLRSATERARASGDRVTAVTQGRIDALKAKGRATSEQVRKRAQKVGNKAAEGNGAPAAQPSAGAKDAA